MQVFGNNPVSYFVNRFDISGGRGVIKVMFSEVTADQNVNQISSIVTDLETAEQFYEVLGGIINQMRAPSIIQPPGLLSN